MARLIRHDATGPDAIEPSSQTRWVCRCGLSQTLPLCDGSHGNCKHESPGKVYVYSPDRRCVVEVRDDETGPPVAEPRGRFGGLVPILSVRSVPASIEHYTRVLGFRMDWDWGKPATFASVSRDSARIFLCQGVQGHAGTWLSIFVDDVDHVHREYVASGATIRQPPTNFPWGMREMNVEDPDGHRLRIGSGTDQPSDNVSLPEA